MATIETFRKVNEFNTPLNEAFYSDISKEVKEELNSAIDEIMFIQRLISPNIVTIDQLEKDELGRIIVDVTNPHVLVDMDYFTQAAEHYRKHGCYTLHPVNSHPKSAYMQFWAQEKDRIKNGMVREDGEWIPGQLYFYWNYSPIKKTRRLDASSKKSERITDFPDIWLGDYLWYHYLDQASKLGEHGEIMKMRGIGFSFKMGSHGPRRALFYKGSNTFYVAADMQYLTKDGVISKAWSCLDFLAENTPFPRLRVKDQVLEVEIGYKDLKTGAKKGMKSKIIGLSTKDDPDKIRGKRGEIIFEEYGAYPHIKKAWNVSRASVEDGDNVFDMLVAGGCVCAGTKVYTGNGDVKNIEDVSIDDGIIGYDFDSGNIVSQRISYIQPITQKPCVRIQTSNRILECSVDHPILVRRKMNVMSDEVVGTRTCNKNGKSYTYPRKKRYDIYYKEWIAAGDLDKGDVILIANSIDFWGNDRLFDARLVGMLIGDGSYGMRMHHGKPEFKTPMFSNCDSELIKYVEDNYDTSVEKSYITKDGRRYCEIRIRDLVGKLKDVGIAGQSKNMKLLPPNFMRLTKDDSAKLLAGLFDTDGCVTIGGKSTAPCVSISQYSHDMLVQIKQLLEKFGISSSIRIRKPRIADNRKDRNEYSTLDIRSMDSIINFRNNIPLMIQYKIDNLNKIVSEVFSNPHRTGNKIPNTLEEYIQSIEDIGIRDIYNLTADGSHTYLANGIITHNTGGTIGSDFEGAEDMFYYPGSYNIHAVSNVFDRNINGNGKCGFFWGAYLNRANCYDKNGMPDVTKALKALIIELDRIRKESSDPRAVTQRKAEYPITPQDSMMKIDGTIFPVADIREYVESIMPKMEEFVGPHYIGDLIFNKNGFVDWTPNGDNKPIREFPLRDNKYEGAIEIFERPNLINGEPQRNRYIAGIDPYDDDTSTTVSLGSIFIFDLFTDRIVAEYTGRPKFANDFYESCRRMLLYYNAVANYENDKKGLFQYFDRKNSTYLLTDTLQSLRDMEMVKGGMYGNKVKGTNSGRFINARGRQLIVNWMLTDAHGHEAGSNVLNLHKIRSIGLLLETMKWDPNGNFDRVSALGMLMLLREDRQKFLDNYKSSETEIDRGLQFDDYFIKNSRGTLSYNKFQY